MKLPKEFEHPELIKAGPLIPQPPEVICYYMRLADAQKTDAERVKAAKHRLDTWDFNYAPRELMPYYNNVLSKLIREVVWENRKRVWLDFRDLEIIATGMCEREHAQLVEEEFRSILWHIYSPFDYFVLYPYVIKMGEDYRVVNQGRYEYVPVLYFDNHRMEGNSLPNQEPGAIASAPEPKPTEAVDVQGQTVANEEAINVCSPTLKKIRRAPRIRKPPSEKCYYYPKEIDDLLIIVGRKLIEKGLLNFQFISMAQVAKYCRRFKIRWKLFPPKAKDLEYQAFIFYRAQGNELIRDGVELTFQREVNEKTNKDQVLVRFDEHQSFDARTTTTAVSYIIPTANQTIAPGVSESTLEVGQSIAPEANQTIIAEANQTSIPETNETTGPAVIESTDAAPNLTAEPVTNEAKEVEA